MAELAALAGNRIPDEEVGDKAGVGEGGLGNGGGVILLQPGCDGGSFIGVHRLLSLNHHFLQDSVADTAYMLSVESLIRSLHSIPCYEKCMHSDLVTRYDVTQQDCHMRPRLMISRHAFQPRETWYCGTYTSFC